MYNFPKQDHNTLFILHANRIYSAHYIVICDLSGCTIFSTLSHKWYNFQKKVFEHKILVWFSPHNMSEKLLTVRRIQWDIIMKLHRSSREVPITFVRLKQTWIFLRNLKKNPQVSNFMKICPVGAELSMQTGRHNKVNICFWNFGCA